MKTGMKAFFLGLLLCLAPLAVSVMFEVEVAQASPSAPELAQLAQEATPAAPAAARGFSVAQLCVGDGGVTSLNCGTGKSHVLLGCENEGTGANDAGVFFGFSGLTNANKATVGEKRGIGYVGGTKWGDFSVVWGQAKCVAMNSSQAVVCHCLQ